ncbi:MAG: hypothetical protein RMK57_10760 [Bryobacterales bacterium]|nr:hypothetical protein [Bryobacteraceae bacterium]MDW8354998.1 hypothetical protein [Bryobacterales bacterium]
MEGFRKLLEIFPFSRQAPVAPTLKVYAVEYAEPPALEQRLTPDATPESVVATVRDFYQEDCACLIEGHWDLWHYEDTWKLKPTCVLLWAHGPHFDSGLGDHLRIEAGLDTYFLPHPDVPGSARRVQSNLQSLLRLARELAERLPLERRQLWTETGESFLEKLQAALPEV